MEDRRIAFRNAAMFQKSPRSETLGCLVGLLGCLSGCLIGAESAASYAEEVRAADPDAFICGMSAVGAMFVGMVFGGFGGTLLGAILGALFPNRSD